MLADVVDPRRIRYYGYWLQPLDRCTRSQHDAVLLERSPLPKGITKIEAAHRQEMSLFQSAGVSLAHPPARGPDSVLVSEQPRIGMFAMPSFRRYLQLTE